MVARDGGRRMRVWDGHVHTAIFKMDNQQGPTELCSMLSGSMDRRGVWGRMDTRICMVKSLCYSPETIKTLLTGYTPIQNKNFKKKGAATICMWRKHIFLIYT